MRRTPILVAGAAALAVLLAACAPKPAERVAAKRAEQPSWDAAADPFVVSGWKSGDKVSWQQQLSARAQTQNEYLRVH